MNSAGVIWRVFLKVELSMVEWERVFLNYRFITKIFGRYSIAGLVFNRGAKAGRAPPVWGARKRGS
jgi:hypothetical protein